MAARIDRLQKSELESRITVRYDERFQAFLLPGLVLLVMGMLVGARWQTGSAGLLGAVLLLLSGPARAVGPFETNPPLVERGLKAYDDGRFEDALRDFTAAEQEAPGHPALEYNRGNALYRLGRYDRQGRVPAGRGRSGPVPPGARPLQHGQRAGAARRHAGGASALTVRRW